MKKMVLWAVLALVIGLGAYIRLAPSDPAQWNVAPVAPVDQDLPGGVVRVVETGPDGLQRLDQIIRATPRTAVLAGSVDAGMITYITRTKWIGFPDYTTVQQHGNSLRVHGRLRFGRKDFGVNKARVDGWLQKM
ncbi:MULTISPECIES: DUF1499 domain-containing protein [unclassified Ruegeria]|uniref:DUF1499 domain-containing protein n=1 Tax=unclassified Ruegeria TaxID=2625375 RepID=UPI00148959C9|nr:MULTISPECIES: DUF1499 domain-containing protein [unclassified Ruegeria]NOD63094.1 DUF1499 domain-containing protein [Ruegeria sp. HKCCD6109]